MSKDILPETLLKEAVEKAREMETSVYEKKITQGEEHVFSDEYRQRMEKLISGEKDNDGLKIVNHFVKKRSVRFKIILIAAIIMLMGSMTVLAVEPLREKVYQFVEHLFSDHTYIEFKKNEEEEDSQIRTFNPDDYPRKPKWIPEGYSLSFEDDVPEVFSFAQVYWNGDKQIVYEQIAMEYSDGWGMTSDGTPAEEIMIGDRKAYMLTDEGGYHNIILEEDGFAYCVGGNVNVDVEILVKCFESVFEEESVE